MLNVLVADDEIHFRNYMEWVLDWESLGFRICSMCKNGAEVLQAVREESVHIALLDINMPGIDGLTLAEKLKSEQPQLLIVFITGYSEFEYARKAVRIGADEYILKPFSEEELIQVMGKLKVKLLKRQEEAVRSEIDHQIVREELLKRLISLDRQKNTGELFGKLSELGVDFTGKYVIISVMEIDDIFRMRQEQEDIPLWCFSIANIAEEMLECKGISHVIFQEYEDRIVSIYGCDSEASLEAEVIPAWEKLIVALEEFFSFTITVGVSTPLIGKEEIAKAYGHARKALGEKFLMGGRRVISYASIAGLKESADFYRVELNDRLLHALRRQDEKEIGNILNDLQEMIAGRRLSQEYAAMAMSGMMSVCLSYILEMNGSIEEIYGRDFQPYTNLYNQPSLKKAVAFLEQSFEIAMAAFKNTYSHRSLEISAQVENYIRAHYQDMELTVEQVAAGVFLDSSYIRRVISRHLGCTVSDLILRIRMQEAKKLMDEGELPVARVAEHVGFGEPGYFSKCFKKQFGISPKAYCEEKKKHL